MKRLWVNSMPESVTIDDFVWRRPADGPSSIWANLTPDLSSLGTIPPLSRDLVWLAVAAFLTDRTVMRPGGWQRTLEVQVPVSDPATWGQQKPQIEELLSFLTSDVWAAEFVAAPMFSTEDETTPSSEEDLVSLFSGGSDSACGAIQALSAGHKPVLLSHWDWTIHAGVQTSLISLLEKHFETKLDHLQVNIGRAERQLGGGTFSNEPSRRTRSLLFVALGLAIASRRQVFLSVPENGFTSLNPPLAAERLGSLSTRTTHPRFFLDLQNIISAIGVHSSIQTPFSSQTKGEMFKHIAGLIGNEGASEILSASHSCSHARWAGMYGMSPGIQCGLCLGCLVRRGAFLAAGLEDRSIYMVTDLPAPKREEFLTALGRAEIEATRYALSRTYDEADIVSMDLPADFDLDHALSLIRRGFEEMNLVPLP
jgi:7-cyano-7-deazaguanine synthase in queuosine biosynthesis